MPAVARAGLWRLRFIAAMLTAGPVAWPTAAIAGPPYVTDDPEPTDFRHWEIYGYTLGTVENHTTATEAGVELNYGGFRDVQLAATVPFTGGSGDPLALGDIELAVKYKVLHQGKGFPLDLALYPRVFLPTGLGSTRAQVLLPVWGEYDWTGWSVFGGGGYTFNPGVGNRNFWQDGVVVTHDVRPGFTLGLEYYGQGPARWDDRAIAGVNLGAEIHLKGPFSLIGSFGQGLNRRQTIFYAALKLNL